MIGMSFWFFTIVFLILLWGNILIANASEDEVPWFEKIEIGYKKGLYIKTMDGIIH